MEDLVSSSLHPKLVVYLDNSQKQKNFGQHKILHQIFPREYVCMFTTANSKLYQSVVFNMKETI